MDDTNYPQNTPLKNNDPENNLQPPPNELLPLKTLPKLNI